MTTTPDSKTKPLGIVEAFVRVLFFRATTEEILGLGWKHLACGLACTWLVGMGRYWDNPRAEQLQHLGLGSVIYVFVLAAFLWLVVWPLKPANWSYFRLLVYITLTSPPAALYALPVEKWIGMDAAINANLTFLWIVAAWRVALLFRFLFKVAELRGFTLVTAAMGPIAFILISLALLNLQKVVFDFMGGFRHRPGVQDAAYISMVLIAALTYWLGLPVVITYIILVFKKHALIQRIRSASKMTLAVSTAALLLLGGSALAFILHISAPGKLADEGEGFLYQDNLPKAMQIANRCIAQYPDSAEGYGLRGLILKKQGKLAEALEDFEKAVKFSSGGFNTNAIHAFELCSETGQWERAEAFVEKTSSGDSLKLKQANIFSHQNKEAAEMKALNEAVAIADKQLGDAPDSELVNELKPPPENRRYYQEDTDLSTTLEARAAALFEHGKVKEAVNDARRAVRLHPNYDARFLLGVTLLKTDRKKDGVDLLNNMLLGENDHLEEHWRKARVFWALGDYYEASRSYLRAMNQLENLYKKEKKDFDRNDPRDEIGTQVALLLEAARCCNNSGNPLGAENFLKIGLSLFTQSPKNPKIGIALARALLWQGLGTKDKAEEEVEEARKLGYKGVFPPPSYYFRIPEQYFHGSFYSPQRQSPELVFVPTIFWSKK